MNLRPRSESQGISLDIFGCDFAEDSELREGEKLKEWGAALEWVTQKLPEGYENPRPCAYHLFRDVSVGLTLCGAEVCVISGVLSVASFLDQ